MAEFDVILVGGGLANGLAALRLAALKAELRVLVVEAGATIGGNHTWCFHATDVSGDQDGWLKPLASAVWDDQEVRFPGRARRLDTGYRAIHSSTLAKAVGDLASVSVVCNRRVGTVGETEIVFEGGETLGADCVIDGRGLAGVSGLALGHQKFVGFEVELEAPHGLRRPVIMDATVAQIDGYRFMYCLPFSPTRVLVEDTYYADRRVLEVDAVARRIEDYIAAAGWRIARHVREERGNLPIVLDGDISAFRSGESRPPARVGMRAGLFHQTTGYSLPLAAEVADTIAALQRPTTAEVRAKVDAIAAAAWQRQSFFRLLNRMLFVSAHAHERVAIMERFYGLSQGLIERFYAGRLTTFDKARILTGKPPIPILRALKGFDPASARDRMATVPPPAAGPALPHAVSKQPPGRDLG